MELIGANGIAMLAAAPDASQPRTLYIYRQDSDFYYLTDSPSPKRWRCSCPGAPQGEYMLFCRERDPERETWDGPRAGPEGAVGDFGADDAFPITDLDEILPGLIERCERVYYAMGAQPEFDQQGARLPPNAEGEAPERPRPEEIIALDHVLHDMRLYKSREEAGVMREAARIAVARASPRHARTAGPAWRVRDRGRAHARIRPPRRHVLLPAHRGRAAPTPASCTTARTTPRSSTASCCWSTPAASTRCTRRTSPAPCR